MTGSYGELLARLNGLDAAGFAGWEFPPGTGFGECAAWWRQGTLRATPHEGLDIRCYRTADGGIASLGPGALVPVAGPGEVVAIVEDFLGRSVFVAHAARDGEGRGLCTVYGHVDPRPGLAPGTLLGGEGSLGTLADPAARGSRVPAHLHLTLAWIGGAGPPDWDALRDPVRARLLDPGPLLCGTMAALR